MLTLWRSRVAVLLAALVGGGLQVEAQTGSGYDYTTQFSTTANPQPNGWAYRTHTNALMTFSATTGRWIGPLTFQTIGHDVMHPASTGGSRVQWKAPVSGNFLLHVAAGDTDGSCGDGVYVNVRHKGALLSIIIVPNGQTVPLTFDRTLAIAQNDLVEVEVTAGAGTNASCDSTSMVIQLSPSTAPPSQAVHVEVRVAVDEGPVHTRATGFLSGIGPTAPPSSEITPLKPKMFRGIHVGTHGSQVGLPVYDRIIGFGAVSQHFMQSQYNAFAVSQGRPSGEYPGDNGHWTSWENYVGTTVQNETAAGRSHEYDLWNEPNLDFFWPAPRTDTQMFELLCRGYKRAKQVNPNAQIVSPSVGGFDSAERTYLQNYLLYAKANNCIPDVISWHEINAVEDPWQVVSHATFVRNFLTAQNITPHPRLSINEYSKPRSEERPGVIAVYLSEITRAKIDTAAHACWHTADSPTQESCGKDTLDGLLTLAGGRRGTWWVHAAFAAHSGRFVEVFPATQSLYGSASWEATANRVITVLGNPRNATLGNMGVRFSGLPGAAATATVTKERLSRSASPVTGWTLISTTASVPVSGGALETTLPAVGPFEAFRVTVQLQASQAPAAPSNLAVR
jgi:hypothetical protein